MEYVPGVKINQASELDRMGVDRTLLSQRAVECYLQQLLTYGFFHAGAPWSGTLQEGCETSCGLPCPKRLP